VKHYTRRKVSGDSFFKGRLKGQVEAFEGL
jgi:hypothetical protein